VSLKEHLGGFFSLWLSTKTLKEGGFGSVTKAIWRGYTVAVKKLISQKLSKEALLDFVQEAEAMQ
jgi:hypothetical protein